MQQTPQSNRLHIGILGLRNSGKSSLLNALTQQQVSLVSSIPGTTTDPVSKAMELPGLGPVLFLDTAGFDDTGTLGSLRVEKTRKTLSRLDMALLVCTHPLSQEEKDWAQALAAAHIPVVPVLSKADTMTDAETAAKAIENTLGQKPVVVSSHTREGIPQLLSAMLQAIPSDAEAPGIIGHRLHRGDTVLLVMPQDIQAPKGRLILPQVQTLRDLLDHGCLPLCCTVQELPQALQTLSAPPVLIITDSQVFPQVYAQKPKESRLTSFSVLMAGYKGDILTFAEGAAAIDALTPASRVLVAEACTHAPQEEDIGRVKIPRLLRKKAGETLAIDMVSGADFPDNLAGYDLVIHCGACMFNRKHVVTRIASAQAQGVPITNYGVALAHLAGILDKIDLGV